MSRADYAHWNEEQDRVWWEEEGKHAESDAENARWERDEEASREYSAADAFAEEVGEMDTEQIVARLNDAEHCARWPHEVPILQRELQYREEGGD